LLQASSWLFGQALYLVAGSAPAFFLLTIFLLIRFSDFSFDLKGARMFEGLFQPTHLLLIFGIALLVFGPKKLPELGKGIGEGIRGFKSAMKADEDKPLATATTVANDQSLTKE
jgi:sec-independent protein translocase protein TatA